MTLPAWLGGWRSWVFWTASLDLKTMPAISPRYAGKLDALLCVLSRTRYERLVLPHNLAAELQSEQLARNFNAGTFPGPNWAADTLTVAESDLASLRGFFAKATTRAAVLGLVALAIAFALGKVNPSLPADFGKVASAAGALLAALGSFLQFSPPRETLKGNMLHEVAHSLLVRVFAAIGIVVAAVGGLWWQ